MSSYSPSCEKPLSTAQKHLPIIGPYNRHLIFAIPIDPHARKPHIDRKFIQKIFYAVALIAVTPFTTARSGADKVYPDAWDVRD